MEPVMAHKDERFIGCDVSPCAFEMYWRLRGLEDAMMDFALNPDLSMEMLKRCGDFAYRLSEGALERYELDWLWTGDDAGSQIGMMFSPQNWREMIKPNLKRIFDLSHANDTYVAFHSCGAIRPIIGDLVEIGLDVLNPIQCNCDGMDPLELKKEFGENLAFMGGVDTQDLLPNGSVDDVRKATARLVEGMTADGGGYILAASHTVPPETPDENIFAMYNEAGLSKEAIFDAAADIRNGSQ
jgi:uroporphyrinogen decarboxylase